MLPHVILFSLTHPHFAPHPDIHFDREEIKDSIVEGLKSGKISGVGLTVLFEKQRMATKTTTLISAYIPF